jgi:erythromycin esterase-like protein
MWRNAVVVAFVEWLRAWNRAAPGVAGFYGMDLYSLHASIQAVLEYLDKYDPEAARRARERYACFDHFGADPQNYGFATTFKGEEPCEDMVVKQLVELQRKHAELIRRDGHVAEEEFFSAEQNARLIVNAERYYRAMFRGRAASWNLRDQHMFEMLNEIISRLESGRGKVVVWAHNSHLGDARATEMAEHGELNVGQLIREHFGERALLIGFTTHSGTVTAASNWDEPAECKRVRPALTDNYEELFHTVGIPCFWLNLRPAGQASELLRKKRLERAIGVIYRPETERQSHYFYARLADQFDAIIHLDETQALEPLERNAEWERSELPETYPSAL